MEIKRRSALVLSDKDTPSASRINVAAVRESGWYQDVIGLLENRGRRDLIKRVEGFLDECNRPEVASLKFHYDGMEQEDRELADPSVSRERKVEITAERLIIVANLNQLWSERVGTA